MVSDSADVSQAKGDTFGLEELRVEALNLVVLAIASLAFSVDLVVVLATNMLDASWLALAWGLILAAGLTRWALRYGSVLAASVFVSTMLTILVAALCVFEDSFLVFWFLPIVIVGGVLIDWWCGAAIAAAGSGAIIAARLVGGFVPDEAATGGLLLIWLGCLLCWLLSHPTRTALDWAWHSYVRAMRMTEELRDRQGELAGVVKSLNNAYLQLEQLNVDLARAREVAEQARLLKAEFAAAISHELRTPLNLIIGFSEMMVTAPQTYNGQTLPDAYRGDVEAVYRNACHLSNLVDDVLDLSQIEADRMGLQKEHLRLAPVVDEAVSTIAGLFDGKGLALEVEVPLDLPPVYADRTRVRQVLINLLSNAARFTDQGGVRVRAWCEGADVVAAVSDTGIGLAPENLAAVFEEFRQVHVLGERRLVGSGLGLAVSKRFVELHGGSMWVESRVGEGSTFYFSLPSCESVVASPEYSQGDRWLPPVGEGEAGNGSILVLDQVGDATRLFARHLDGFSVLAVDSVEQVQRLASEVATRALVVVSANAQDWPSLWRIREAVPDVPVIACSLHTGKVAARELGVSDYLVKPVSREQILVALRRLGKGVRSVLVVDDDAEMVRLLGRMVRSVSRRYTVWEAQSGLEALSLLEAKRPDAVLLDLIMPDLSGDEVLRRMRADARLRDVPVVLVSARGLAKETVVAEGFAFTRRDGLSVRELMRCLRTSLEVLQEGRRSTAPGLPGVLPE